MDPPRPDCADGLALALYAQYANDVLAQPKIAKKYFERAIKFGDDDPWVHALAGEFFEATRDWERTNAHFGKAIQLDPEHPLALGDYAMFKHKSASSRKEAIKMYEKATKLYPSHATLLAKQGNLVKHLSQDYDETQACYKRALHANPAHTECLSSYAVLQHGLLQNHEEAAKLYKRALESDDLHTNTLSNYALFLSEVESKHDEAQKLYERALESNPKHANTMYNFAVLLDSVRGDTEGAKAMYRRAVKTDPKHAFAWYNLAVLLNDNGEYDDAEKAFQHSLDASPSDTMTLTDFGNFYLRVRGDVEKAENLVRKALAVSNKMYPPAWLRLGSIQKHKGLFEQAETSFEKCLELDKDNFGALGNLANIYADVHDHPRKAETFYRRALIVKPDNEELLVNLADLLFDVLGDEKKEAGDLYERAIKCSPHNPYVLYNYALFKIANKDKTAAIKLLRQAIKHNPPSKVEDCVKKLEQLEA